MDEGILEVSELAGDRVVELRVDELRVVGLITCEREGIVGGDEGPVWRSCAGCLSRSQSCRSTWRGRTGKRRGSAERGKKEKSSNSERNAHHGWYVDEGERLNRRLEPMWV